MGVSSIAFLLLNFLKDKVIIDVLFVILLTLPGICVAVTNLLVINVVPTYLCGMAICLVMTSGRLGSVVSSSVVGIMLQLDCTVTFLMYTLGLIGNIVLIFFLLLN